MTKRKTKKIVEFKLGEPVEREGQTEYGLVVKNGTVKEQVACLRERIGGIYTLQFDRVTGLFFYLPGSNGEKLPLPAGIEIVISFPYQFGIESKNRNYKGIEGEHKIDWEKGETHA